MNPTPSLNLQSTIARPQWDALPRLRRRRPSRQRHLRRLGFQALEVFTDTDTGEEWNVIALDFGECLARGRS
jgi:hypothetical protein